MNARRKGIKWELYILNKLKEIYPNISTARYASRQYDDLGIDIVGDIPIYVQIKATKAGQIITTFEKYYKQVEFNIKQGKLEYKPFVLIKVFEVGKGKKRQSKDIVVVSLYEEISKLFKINPATIERYNVKRLSRNWRDKLDYVNIVLNDKYFITTFSYLLEKLKELKQ